LLLIPSAPGSSSYYACPRAFAISSLSFFTRGFRHPGQPADRICLPWMVESLHGEADWIVLMLLGVFQLGLSYICYAVAIKKVTAMEGILIPMLEPILNPLWTFIFLGERLGLWAIIGGFVVILSILFRNVMNSKFH
jgi:drug/metabolite transporter (DMT)-like permease